MSQMPKRKKDRRVLERDVKVKIRNYLTEHEWFWWNVPMNSYAKSGISDIHAVDKEDPTEVQKGFLTSVAAEEHFAFVVDNDNLPVFAGFLAALDRSMIEVSHNRKTSPEDGAVMLNAIKEMTRKF